MTADKIRVELELVDGSFITRIVRAGQSVRTFERTVKSVAATFGETTTAADKGVGALQKLASQADGVRANLDKVRKAADDAKGASASLAAAGPAPAGGGKPAPSPPDTGEATPDPKTMSFEQLMRSWGNTTARLKESGKDWLTNISEELAKQLVTGKASLGKVGQTALVGLAGIEIRAIMSKLFSGDLIGDLGKGLAALPDAIGSLFGWLTGDTGGKGVASGAGGSGPLFTAGTNGFSKIGQFVGSETATTPVGGDPPASGVGGGAAASSGGAADKPEDKNKETIEQVLTKWGDTTERLKEKSRGWLEDLSTRLATLVVTGKAKFGDLTKTILTGLVEIEIRATMSKLFSGELFNSLGKGLQLIPEGISSLFGWMGRGLNLLGVGVINGMSPLGMWQGFHSGGIVGREATFSRLAPAGLFANAARFHTGGFPGLSPDEVPAILRKGEGVFTPEQMAGLGGQVVNQTVNVNLTAAGGTPQQNSDLAERIGRQVQEQLRGMVAGEIRQQMRPGGMLAA